MKVRQAITTDASEISAFLQALAARGKRNLPSDIDFVVSHYIEHPDTIQCAVAEDGDGALMGLQILKRASVGNPYGVAVGWGIIGTHVNPEAARRGVGRALFAATRTAAARAQLAKIDATIGARNAEGLGYYEAMGFRTYKTAPGKVCKCFELV